MDSIQTFVDVFLHERTLRIVTAVFVAKMAWDLKNMMIALAILKMTDEILDMED